MGGRQAGREAWREQPRRAGEGQAASSVASLPLKTPGGFPHRLPGSVNPAPIYPGHRTAGLPPQHKNNCLQPTASRRGEGETF